MEILPIAHILTEFNEKFGIPRQSGLAPDLTGVVVFEPEFRSADAVRGLEGFSHIWLIWEFSANRRADGWQPLVRPPRLGGNRHMGVFATRSPFRPNPLGLSCVRLEKVLYNPQDGPVLVVRGADLMNGTPIYDIKPYIGYADCRPDAVSGYVDKMAQRSLDVIVPDAVRDEIGDRPFFSSLLQALSLDPRPSYHDDPQRIYGMSFGGYNVRFRVEGSELIVIDAGPLIDNRK